MGELSDDVKSIYNEKCKLFNAVVPNCGQRACLKMNPTGSAGFFVGRKKAVSKRVIRKASINIHKKKVSSIKKEKQNRKRKAKMKSVQKNKKQCVKKKQI